MAVQPLLDAAWEPCVLARPGCCQELTPGPKVAGLDEAAPAEGAACAGVTVAQERPEGETSVLLKGIRAVQQDGEEGSGAPGATARWEYLPPTSNAPFSKPKRHDYVNSDAFDATKR